jgi:hypothetical protein
MKQKTLIAVYGTANVGKSMTISELGRNLNSSGGITSSNISLREYRAIMKYLNHSIGLQTYGDLEYLVRDGLNIFLKNNCDLIVIATKSYGATVDTLGAFAGANGYRIIWIAPFEVRDNTIATNVIKEYCAAHLLTTINDIITGTI